MFFDCSALLLGLVAAVVARWRPNDRYTYGYVRADTLAGFVNAVFLVFIAFFILSEAIEVCIKSLFSLYKDYTLHESNIQQYRLLFFSTPNLSDSWNRFTFITKNS
jgi:divalent metal cation (Fe/Co/Zn/Cd) transporter